MSEPIDRIIDDPNAKNTKSDPDTYAFSLVVEDPGPTVTSSLSCTRLPVTGGAPNKLNKTVTGHSIRVHHCTHEKMDDTHTLKVTMRAGGTYNLSISRRTVNDSVEATIRVMGRIRQDVDGTERTLWDGFAKPIEASIALPAGGTDLMKQLSG